MSEIIVEYPAMYATIAKLMMQRPRRMIKTSVLYLWGPTGVGKTTMVFRVLKTLAREGLIDYYSKGGGLKKYWDGYDNQPIAWIDDPVSPEECRDSESIQQLKNVMSVGDCFVEVKYGTMVFDSNLLIITSNIDPMKLAVVCGEENRDPIYRRLTDTCGSYWLGNVSDNHYHALCEFISESCGVQIDIDSILKQLPPMESRNFSVGKYLMGFHALYPRVHIIPLMHLSMMMPL